MGPGATVRVNKDDVLQAAADFDSEANRLEERVAYYPGEMTAAAKPVLRDPGSRDVSNVLKKKLREDGTSYINRAQEYVRQLRTVANQLR
ncbi:hypothetical protein LX15_003397 [Streptoalloteichus tenebrarius]|uniref:Uncharacterized protein n=2 Tax=Streptoalloteichus tenebrarius (strain ATCC 17920 / DSM 40477 / JCM 4838 / CBS 697.72 / NBRC 16177 / NCIMB 11028 / NRRL B-12390 / A12253. 1 / ISP 5477) TaxID=1933 RepID=A0ABT1HVZ8_STRSD|nr:hypothetical protein [Streptoalloteichus tenebrarius]BFF00668.1 hypothetical protein GCM10020241_23430 [Streptoalloteichus tenebrarius]